MGVIQKIGEKSDLKFKIALEATGLGQEQNTIIRKYSPIYEVPFMEKHFWLISIL